MNWVILKVYLINNDKEKVIFYKEKKLKACDCGDLLFYNKQQVLANLAL